MKPIFAAPFFVLFLVTMLTFDGISQDWVVINSGDTVKCTITKVTDKYLYYIQNFNGVSAKGKILKSNINEWRYMLQTTEQEQPVAPPPPEISEKPDSTGRFRGSIQGGFAYLTGNTDVAEDDLIVQGSSEEEAKSYYKDLKTGYQGNITIYYRIAKDLWLGGSYKGFFTTSNIMTSLHADDIHLYYGEVSERYFVNFAGASILSSSRFGKDKRFGVYSAFTIGPAFYRDEAELMNQQVLIQGTTLGTDLILGLEYFIKPRLSVSIGTSLFMGKIKKYTVTTASTSNEVTLDKENYDNLSRIDVSAGIVFYW